MFICYTFAQNTDWFVLSSSVQTFQPIILICRKGISVYNNRGFTIIYRQLSFPLRCIILKVLI